MSAGISWVVVILANIGFLTITLIDFLFLPRKNQLSLKRVIPDEMERGIQYQVKLEITNKSKYPITYRLIDGIPQSFLRPFPLKGMIGKESKAILLYETTAPIRGEYQVKKVYVRYQSIFGLWEKQATEQLENKIKVIPNLSETKRYLENAQRFLMYEGVKIRKFQQGTGEFSKIRNYVVGDDPRKINWRQTAKLHEVMTNEFEPEHGKYITILIDCGRMMGAELSAGNRLEKALEAAITVTAAALQKGDYVAVLAFSKNVKIYVPPAKGMAHLQRILYAIYNLEVDAAESNYGEVLQYLQTVQKKRSLILLFSDVRTFLHEESALLYLKRLRQRHLFLMIGVEDEALVRRIQEEPASIHSAMIKSMAQKQMIYKKREKRKWEQQGLQMVEAEEENLAVTAVSSYIQIMNRGIL
ncbi:DUF58 domain-containing protein [Bacillus sp. PS06]|nr:DUF58 domain-containing protein [Bacillus sp. PS06]